MDRPGSKSSFHGGLYDRSWRVFTGGWPSTPDAVNATLQSHLKTLEGSASSTFDCVDTWRSGGESAHLCLNTKILGFQPYARGRANFTEGSGSHGEPSV